MSNNGATGAPAQPEATSGRMPRTEDWLIVCRCEELYEIDIVEAVRAGARTLDEVKRLTRCGMGPCQWKACWGVVAEIVARGTATEVGQTPPPSIRPPVRPVRLDELTMTGTTALGGDPPID